MLSTGASSQGRLALLWHSETPWLVLPERYTRSEAFTGAASASAERGWPVAPRKTGGGITPQGPGVLNLALVFTADPGQSRSVRDTYSRICDPLTEAFARLGVQAEATPVEGSFCDGDFNLAVKGRKLVGTAQRWRGPTCLIHALIMTDIALAPAVDAVAQFSAELGHDTVFDPDVHCRLADLCEPDRDVNDALQQSLWQVVIEAGFTAYTPQGSAAF